MESTQPVSWISEESWSRRVVVSGEAIAYIALLLLALVFRVAELDSVPMTVSETRPALAAWRAASVDAPGADIVPESSALFLAQYSIFSVLGASEFTARLLTALVGAVLVISPALFRGLLGREWAFLTSLVLFFSPVLLGASRFSSPVIWSLLFVMIGLWACWRWWAAKSSAHGVLATVMLVALVLLAEPGGLVFAVIIVAALLIALGLSALDKSDDNEPPNNEKAGTTSALLREWPWQNGLLMSALTVLLVSTIFMLHPQGLGAVGEALGGAVRGLTTVQPDGVRGFPLFISIFYEPLLWVFPFVAVWMVTSRAGFSFVERFLIAWLVLGTAASIFYVGTRPDHALWVSVPLAALTGWTLVRLLIKVEHPIWETPGWSKVVLAIVTFGLVTILSIHIQSLGRSLLTSPTFAQVNSVGVVWVLITLMFMVIGYFLASSLWGMTTAAQGGALGILAFALLASLGSGWDLAVPNADSPLEPWHNQATSPDVTLLRSTMFDLADRQSAGFPVLGVVALTPEDGLVAWVLRDFKNARFVTDLSEARGQEIVILPEFAEAPGLGGDYVGDEVIITQSWSTNSLQISDIPAWWMQGNTRVPALPSSKVILWLRQDIYNGIPFQDGFGAG